MLTAAAFFAGILNAIGPRLRRRSSCRRQCDERGCRFPPIPRRCRGIRRERARFDRGRLVCIALASLASAPVGSLLLLVSSNEVFAAIIPVLLLTATACFAFRDRVQPWAGGGRFSVRPYGAIGTVLVSVYGGYFNGGLGIVLLALFALWGMHEAF